MEIIVEGKGKVQYEPEVIKINVIYDFVEKFYDKALKTGTESFNQFVEEVLPKLNLERKDLKTNSFNIERIVEEDSGINRRSSYVYNFRQEASFELDYSNENIEIFMTEIIKLNNIPKYYISFDVKDKEKAAKEALKNAFEQSRTKAELIAMTSGKELKGCKRTDFKPIENAHNTGVYTSATKIEEGNDLEVPSFLKKRWDVFTDFTNSFTPENITISETIFTVWIAE